jgi:cation:H+ antiporter
MLHNVALLLVGLICLFYGGNWLVRGASNLALSFGVSVLIIALTFVAIGTSMPELLVSLQAALVGKSDLAIGNVIGSNIANIGLILGATGLITPLSVKAILLRREIPIMILFTVCAFALTLDGGIDRLDGSLLLLAFVGFNAMFYRLAKRERGERERLPADLDEKPRGELNRGREFTVLLLGILALALGSRMMVEGAVNLARLVGISELVIAITLVAFGTSLPELAASLSAAYHRETDLAIGNVVGSNIANVGLILGISALVVPLHNHHDGAERQAIRLVRRELPFMLGTSLLVLIFTAFGRLGRFEGVVLLALMAYFLIVLVRAGDAEATDPQGVSGLRSGLGTLVGLALLAVGAACQHARSGKPRR